MTTSGGEPRTSKLEASNREVGPSTIGNRQSSITLPLLLEVGCEEIPARFLRDAERGLGERIKAALEESRVLPESPAGATSASSPDNGERHNKPLLLTYSTPRRLVVYVPALRTQQPDKIEEIIGPPVKVAIDSEGKYTRAAESFAQKNSARLEDLIRATTPKGEYLSLKKMIPGVSAQKILPEILPPAILGLSFPKSMYWTGKSAPRFVRPIRWVLAILGEGKQVVTLEFEILGVKSGNFTFGHRVKGVKPRPVTGFKDYSNKLRHAFVEIDPAKRLEKVINESNVLVENSGFKLLPDEWLADWIANSTEWPRPILGSFDERFLHLPREILITVMRDHQRYFAIERLAPSGVKSEERDTPALDRSGGSSGDAKLAPHFVAVLNMGSDEKGLIRQGHERVLTARFRDAEFFWNADQKTPLRDRVLLLDKVTYQAKLGTYGDKVRRMRRLGTGLWARLNNEQRLEPSAENDILHAINLCKCDLTTQMVQEFPELQGVVGGLYAKKQGESDMVANAIYDHYRPQGADDENPRSLIGAVVALADKLDAVASGFVAGLAPTGSSDPFGLRRQGNGLVRIMVDFSIDDNLRVYVMSSIDGLSYTDSSFQVHTTKANLLADDVVEFLRERVGFYLESVEGIEYDVVRAALAARESSWRLIESSPVRIVERARALRKVRTTEAFLKLCGAAKRIRNILSKSADSPDALGWNFDEALFETEEERSLGDATRTVEERAQSLAREREFDAALFEMIKLVEPIDTFFDSVLVMAEDRRIRENRLRLLNRLNQMFSAIVDLSQVVVE